MSPARGDEEEEEEKIDESLYSRQLYVLGHDAMRKMKKSHALIVGLNGLGVEIAKNVILAGIKNVSLLDNNIVKINDLSSQFYLNKEDVGKKIRSLACINKLRELNPDVNVQVIEKNFDEKIILSKQFGIICIVENNISHEDLIKYDELCYKNDIKFIIGKALGVFGMVFVNFGDNFEIVDKNGESPSTALIANITKGKPGIVTCLDGYRHNLEQGDSVTFKEIEGMTELNNCKPMKVTKINDAFSFEIEDTSLFKEYKGEGLFIQVKTPITINFKTFKDNIDNPKFISTDYGKDPNVHHLLYLALAKFQTEKGRYPLPNSNNDANLVVDYVKALAEKKDIKNINNKIIWNLARCSNAIINPMCAYLGGIIAQEIMKACTNKFTPIEQLLYFDSVESLPLHLFNEDNNNNNLLDDEFKPLNCRYDDNIAVFGKSLQQKVMNSKAFLVGSGAIGCEILKNWALMGVAASNNGHIWITDMDNIERSNLNRQFLFRNEDVSKLKSETASKAIKKIINDEINITSQNNRVSAETENIYNDQFWNNLTFVCTALDNIDARLYVDSQCLNYGKPLLESGTLGTKGNTQIVVPQVTESYGSSRDPPEKDIPICTLKNFPNKIEHTIQWARDEFEGCFKKIPDIVNNYLNNSNYLEEIHKDGSSELTILNNIHQYLLIDKPNNFNDCIKWSRLKFEIDYNHQIQQLLFNFPKDATTSEGAKFWSAPKRAPDPIVFDIDDDIHFLYLMSASNLFAEIFGLKGSNQKNIFSNALSNIKIPNFVPKKGLKIQTKEEEEKKGEEEEEKNNNNNDIDVDEQIKQLKQSLPNKKDVLGIKLNSIEFEKDNDQNYHIDFITAASNLRARNYKIDEVSKYETKGIAGKIIPAIATTTALVTGLTCFEMYKILQMENKKIEDYKSSFANLAISLFTMSEPMPTPKQIIQLSNDKNLTFTIWDKLIIKNAKDMTLKDLISWFNTNYNLELQMVCFGKATLYAFYMTNDKKQNRIKAKLKKLVEAVTKQKLKEGTKYLDLIVQVCDENDNDIDLPTVRIEIA